jgi:hypothetical protein
VTTYWLRVVNKDEIPGLDTELTYYLSGPMKGYPEHNWPVFTENARYLREWGLKIASPHELNPTAHLDTKVLETYPINYLKADIIEMLLKTQGIILLKGWPKSRGARAELSVALDLEFPVWFYDNYRLTRMSYELGDPDEAE